MEIRFHLDEGMTTAVATGLRLRGIDVTTTSDAGLMGATDPEQLSHALRHGRVIITHDDDFLTLHAQGVPHAGIAFAPPRRRTIGQIIIALVDLRRTRTAEEMNRVVVFV